VVELLLKIQEEKLASLISRYVYSDKCCVKYEWSFLCNTVEVVNHIKVEEMSLPIPTKASAMLCVQ